MKIQNGTPKNKGMYVVYIDSGISKYPKKELLLWADSKWHRPGSDQKQKRAIYGWIGPLPAPSIENLKYCTKKYTVGSKMGREFGSFKAGVFDTLDQALDYKGIVDDFVYEINTDSSIKAVAKWSKSKWVFRKK